MNADERFAHWVEWGDRLVKEIGDAHVERTIWREMTDALDAQLPDSIGFRNHYAEPDAVDQIAVEGTGPEIG